MSWQDLAACRDIDPSLFFPERGEDTWQAKLVCYRCPVREDCLEYALDHGEKFGIWGGKSERERRAIRPGHRRLCSQCQQGDRIERSKLCAPCWAAAAAERARNNLAAQPDRSRLCVFCGARISTGYAFGVERRYCGHWCEKAARLEQQRQAAS